jgi:hypothetical protein
VLFLRSVPRTEAPPDAAILPSWWGVGGDVSRVEAVRLAREHVREEHQEVDLRGSQPKCRRTWLAEGTVIAFQDWLPWLGLIVGALLVGAGAAALVGGRSVRGRRGAGVRLAQEPSDASPPAAGS